MPSHRSIVIFSGGTAANHLVDIFESIRKSKDCPLSYIIPISDNGGSSSELIRVFGGPGIGDVRSRLVRLIPRLPQGSPGFREREAIRTLFNHRFSSTDGRAAKIQWADVVDGTSPLWRDISSAKKELIRSFFNLVNAEITKRSRPPNSTFDFTSASVGNLFLTGARLFSGSFESGIYLLGSVCGVEDESVKVIPSINSNFSHNIAAGLEDGSVIVGQNSISHPSPETAVSARPISVIISTDSATTLTDEFSLRRSSTDHYYGDEHEARDEDQEAEDAHLPGTLATLRTKNITFNKDSHMNDELPARISRIWYINPYGQEILPPANPRAVQALNNAQAVIYSIGSLYTSLAPSLVLKGIGEALYRNTVAAGTGLRTKILILNGCLDREVGPQPPHTESQKGAFSAADFVEAIVRAGEQSRGIEWEDEASDALENADVQTLFTPSSAGGGTRRPMLVSSKSESILRTSLKSSSKAYAASDKHQTLYPPPLLASTSNSRIQSPTSTPPKTPIENTVRSDNVTDALPSLLRPSSDSTSNPPRSSTSFSASKPKTIYNHYVTHIIHLPNSSTTPHVDKDLLLSKYNIKCIRVYGRTVTGADGNPDGMRYDPAALRGAIEAVLGRLAEREHHNSRSGSPSVNGEDNKGTSGGSTNVNSKGSHTIKTAWTRGNSGGTELSSDDEERIWRARGLARRNTLENNGRWVQSM